MKWQRLDVPAFCERLIGFSIPHDDHVLAISYEGVHRISLGTKITIETDSEMPNYEALCEPEQGMPVELADDPYNPASGVYRYHNHDYQIIGLHGGDPVLTSPQGEELVLNTANETLSILRHHEVVFALKYQNFSGDWAAATFSPDGRFVILGCPYDFDLVILERQQSDHEPERDPCASCS